MYVWFFTLLTTVCKVYYGSCLTNKVHNKETNEDLNAWQNYMVRVGFEPGMSRQ